MAPTFRGHMRTFVTVILAGTVVVTAACGRTTPAGSENSSGQAQKSTAPQPSTWAPTIESLASPAGVNTSEPQLFDSPSGMLLSWVENTETKAILKFAERTASGWSEARTAASGDDWFLSWADVPSVMRLSDGTLFAEWLQNTNPDIEAYDLRVSYSKDDGKTWARSFTPHHDRTKTQHGFASMFELPGGGLGLIWLDGRATETDTASPEGGAMSLRYATFDKSWKQTADMPIDGKVCDCCQTSAGVTADGVIAAFRDRSDKEIRDIHVSRLENGKWTPSSSVHDDNWMIPACPVNGPAISARGRNVAIAWFTVKNDQGEAYAAFSNDAGRSWSAPIRLDEKNASTGRVDIELLEDGSAVATWLEFVNQRAQFRMRRVEQSGAASPPITIADGSMGRTNGHPRIARHGDELVLAWTTSSSADLPEGAGMLKVQTAIVRLPNATAQNTTR
jgi:hypothetical protein